MALVGRRDGRNFGCGRQLSYAGPQALKDMFCKGHYGTVKAHFARDILHALNLKGFHVLRAEYACERYEQITDTERPSTAANIAR
ncbi:hypothetical protein [Pseudomonas huaxiensis]